MAKLILGVPHSAPNLGARRGTPRCGRRSDGPWSPRANSEDETQRPPHASESSVGAVLRNGDVQLEGDVLVSAHLLRRRHPLGEPQDAPVELVYRERQRPQHIEKENDALLVRVVPDLVVVGVVED